MKQLFEISDEFSTFKIYELETEYRGILTTYLKGEVNDKHFYSYSKTNIPNDLLVLLIEANNTKLNYGHERMLWNLVDEQYEL